jgi:hypothetical protein
VFTLRSSRYRFEVVAAYCVGVALPVLEICRRRKDFTDIPGYIDDFIVGAVLLFGAWSAARERPYSRALLAGAWGILCGGLWSSFFGQLYSKAQNDISGLPNTTVVCIKLVVYGIAIVALVLSIRRRDV